MDRIRNTEIAIPRYGPEGLVLIKSLRVDLAACLLDNRCPVGFCSCSEPHSAEISQGRKGPESSTIPLMGFTTSLMISGRLVYSHSLVFAVVRDEPLDFRLVFCELNGCISLCNDLEPGRSLALNMVPGYAATCHAYSLGVYFLSIMRMVSLPCL
jgi:hypothetical protein